MYDILRECFALIKEIIQLKYIVAGFALFAFFNALKAFLSMVPGKTDDICEAVKMLRTSTEQTHDTKEKNADGKYVKVTSSIDSEQALGLVIKYRIMTTGILVVSATVFLVIAAVLASK